MSAKFRITINLEPSEYAALQRLATGAERSMAWLGRKAICDFIDQQERAEAPLLAGLSDANGIGGRRAQ